MADPKSTDHDTDSNELVSSSSVSISFGGNFSTATLIPQDGANVIELETDESNSATTSTEMTVTNWETIELSDNSDSHDPDESCVIVETLGDVDIEHDNPSMYNPQNIDIKPSTINPQNLDLKPSTIIVLDSPEKTSDVESVEPPMKKRLLQLPVVGGGCGGEPNASKVAGEASHSTPSPVPSVPYNIFSSLLNSTRANSATPPATPPATPISSTAPIASAATSEANAIRFPTVSTSDVIPRCNSSSSSSRSTSPRTSMMKVDVCSCYLPFCEAKCDVETHHPLLRALSSCIGSLSSSSREEENSVKESTLSAFESVVVEWEAKSTDGWTRTHEINEMAKMKEYYYPLLHTAAVSGCTELVRWMMMKGFGEFTRAICSPLMQCLLNIDCVMRKITERTKTFKEMMELMPSELTGPTLDSADRSTSLLIVVCSRASRDGSDRPFFAATLRNIIAYVTDNFDVETQKSIMQVRNSEGNTCVHELSRLDECLPILRKMYEICQKLGVVESVFKSTNLRGKSALDMAAEAGAIRLVTFLSPIAPASNNTPPPVRTPGEGGREKSAPVDTMAPDAGSESVESGGVKRQERSPSMAKENAVDVVIATEVAPRSENVASSTAVDQQSNAQSVYSAESSLVQLPVACEDEEDEVQGKKTEDDEPHSDRVLFRPLFRDDMKTEAKLKIVEKHLAEKRKLASDVQTRMEKHGKNVDEIKTKISETEEDTRKKIGNIKVIYELLLRTQQSIGVNDTRVKELNAQLIAERKTIAMHEKVSQELSDVTAIMDQLHSTLTNQIALNGGK